MTNPYGAAVEIIPTDTLATLGGMFAEAVAESRSKDAFESIAAAGESETAGRLGEQRLGDIGVAAGPDGEWWKPWSDAYKESKQEKKYLLQREGNLLGGVDHAAGDGFAVWGVGGEDDVVKYATAHQYGSAKNNLPPRPYVGFGRAERQAAEEALADALGRAFGA